MKKRLTQSEEFEIMKLVLDKFLWLGFGVMVFGLYRMISAGADAIVEGIGLLATGAIILVIFMTLIVKEYEILK
ncbi:hypothetical protein J4460_03435 [Candidatus Woesearchaeota archaeon]|nr:MAG: hypothetical protein QS99_C0008G0057 [archaeon GW2011_AR4]MBS3129701.1 hypothetical protein [Candidatus Woesearchaeota archaeon]HIH38805.1 hypothetical protein [Candidatus Woesearchaeota archaeon]HIH49220.1 hypothetical protein [Candidatus Woesearchaeota archaeon]HIJ03363.1 hypothetical protein [Candidatus Woesearchaeota archaeon]